MLENTSQKRLIEEIHAEVDLGSIRPPRTPLNLIEKHTKQHGARKIRAEGKVVILNDWMLGFSIGHDPLIYIAGRLSQQETYLKCVLHVSHVKT